MPARTHECKVCSVKAQPRASDRRMANAGASASKSTITGPNELRAIGGFKVVTGVHDLND